jgi:transposase-like protein
MSFSEALRKLGMRPAGGNHRLFKEWVEAVGRKYGVSDNAVRKWVRFYEREREREGST